MKKTNILSRHPFFLPHVTRRKFSMQKIHIKPRHKDSASQMPSHNTIHALSITKIKCTGTKSISILCTTQTKKEKKKATFTHLDSFDWLHLEHYSNYYFSL